RPHRPIRVLPQLGHRKTVVPLPARTAPQEVQRVSARITVRGMDAAYKTLCTGRFSFASWNNCADPEDVGPGPDVRPPETLIRAPESEGRRMSPPLAGRPVAQLGRMAKTPSLERASSSYPHPHKAVPKENGSCAAGEGSTGGVRICRVTRASGTAGVSEAYRLVIGR